MIYSMPGKSPEIGKNVFVAPNAAVVGDVVLGDNVNVWFGAAIRADLDKITIGNNSNVQENCTFHVDQGLPLTIGEGVTIGHNAVVHSCSVGNRSLIGMGAVLLNSCIIGEECLVAAGALVTERKEFPDGSLIVGSPARVVRQLTDDERRQVREAAGHYVELAAEMKELKEVEF